MFCLITDCDCQNWSTRQEGVASFRIEISGQVSSLEAVGNILFQKVHSQRDSPGNITQGLKENKQIEYGVRFVLLCYPLAPSLVYLLPERLLMPCLYGQTCLPGPESIFMAFTLQYHTFFQLVPLPGQGLPTIYSLVFEEYIDGWWKFFGDIQIFKSWREVVLPKETRKEKGFPPS